jgi:hypothetical protein
MVFNWLEWGGAATGLYGAFLLARDGRDARYGWYFFLAANGFVVAFAVQQAHMGLFVQQLGFTCTSIYGIVSSRKRRDLVPGAVTSGSKQSLESYYESLPCKSHCPSASDPEACRECERVAANQ